MGYGGALIWTGLARNLKLKYPKKKIVFVYPDSIKNSLLNKHPGDHVIFKNNKDIHKLISKIKWGFVKYRYIYNNNYLIVNLQNKDLIYWKKATNERIEFKTGKHAIQFATDYYHIENPVLKPRIDLTDDENKKVQVLLHKFKLKKYGYICIEPNTKTSFTPNKEWSYEKWQLLVNMLNNYLKTNKINLKIVQIGNKTTNILKGIVNLTGTTNFREAAGIISKSMFLVAYPGGLLHLAHAVDKNCVVLLSAWEPKELTTYPNDRIIYKNVSCQNCGLKTPCPNNLKCMSDITTKEAFNECIYLLNKIKGENKI